MLKKLFPLLLLLIATTSCQSQESTNNTFSTAELTLSTPAGEHHQISAEIANTDPLRRQGLMNRRILPQGSGMLFVWQKPRADIAMWMKNTYIPLDMLFLNKKRVTQIVKNTTPHDLTLIRATYPTDMVLELPAGDANRLGLKIGTTLTIN